MACIIQVLLCLYIKNSGVLGDSVYIFFIIVDRFLCVTRCLGDAFDTAVLCCSKGQNVLIFQQSNPRPCPSRNHLRSDGGFGNATKGQTSQRHPPKLTSLAAALVAPCRHERTEWMVTPSSVSLPIAFSIPLPTFLLCFITAANFQSIIVFVF